MRRDEAREEEQRVKDALLWLIGEAETYPEIIERAAYFASTGDGGCSSPC